MKNILLVFSLCTACIPGKAQSSNPYEIFGHTSNVTYETPVTEFLYIKNKDTSSNVKAMALDAENGYAMLLNKDDVILEKVKLQPEHMLRWLSTDPLQAKYPGMSPYNFAGNSPIVCFDPDGRVIKIIHYTGKNNRDGTPEMTLVFYRNGQLQNMDGTTYTGSNKYIRQVGGELDKLKTDHSVTEMMVNTLDNSRSDHIIANIDWQDDKMTREAVDYNVSNNNRSTSINDDPYDSYTKYSGSDIAAYKDVGSTKTKYSKRNSRVGLAHELKHAYDRNNGTLNRSATQRTSNGIPMHEVNAQNVENLVRSKTGDPQNNSRGGKEIPIENRWDSKDPDLQNKMNNR